MPRSRGATKLRKFGQRWFWLGGSLFVFLLHRAVAYRTWYPEVQYVPHSFKKIWWTCTLSSPGKKLVTNLDRLKHRKNSSRCHKIHCHLCDTDTQYITMYVKQCFLVLPVQRVCSMYYALQLWGFERKRGRAEYESSHFWRVSIEFELPV